MRDRLEAIVREAPWLMEAFRALRAMELADGWIVSGAIYQEVWNRLTGRPTGHGIADIDVSYMDADLSWEAEDAVIRRAAPLFPPAPPVQVRNQARVHLWYERKFGHAIPPYASVEDALCGFACTTHAVAMRLRSDDGFDLLAPFGLDDIFAMRLVPNPIRPNRATHEAKAARQGAIWPELTVIPWPT